MNHTGKAGRKVITLSAVVFFSLLCSEQVWGQNIAVNNSGAAPNASAMLDVFSTSKGFLPPRMSTTQRDSIAIYCSCIPAEGLQVFNTTTKCLEIYAGNAWQAMFCACGSAPPTPGTISGSTAVCSGQSGISYSVSAVTGANSCTWSVPSGASVTAGQGTTAVTVTFGSSSGNVSVTATNSCGTSAAANSSVTVSSLPAAPTATSSTGVIAHQITANWNTVSGATGYRLDVSTASNFSSFTGSYNDLNVGNVLSYDVSGLSSGTTYYYRVRAINTCGTSGNSNAITTTTMDLAASLMAYWKFDESSGDATDATGNGNTLTNANAVSYGAAKINNGANFGSSNNHTKVLYRSGTGAFGVNESQGNGMTLAFWMKSNIDPDGAGVGRVIDIGGSNGYTTIQYRKNGSDIQIDIATNSGTAITYITTLSVGTWYHLALTIGTDNITRLYINGSQVGSNGTRGASASGVNAAIGNANNNPGSNSNGVAAVIDEVGVWNRQLSTLELSQLYNSGNGLAYPF